MTRIERLLNEVNEVKDKIAIMHQLISTDISDIKVRMSGGTCTYDGETGQIHLKIGLNDYISISISEAKDLGQFLLHVTEEVDEKLKINEDSEDAICELCRVPQSGENK